MAKTYPSKKIGSASRFFALTLFRFTVGCGVIGISAASAQQAAPSADAGQVATAEGQATDDAGQTVAQVAGQVANPAQQPFPALLPAEQAELDKVLLDWQAQSQGTKTLVCKFERWHFDLLAAPAGIHARKAEGEIKYAAPDKGLIRVDSLMFFKGMKGGKPQYGPIAKRFGEYWVCNGRELIEYDREAEKCNIQKLPANMQGTQIFNSPLPFVFNLDAKRIKQRYWVKLDESPAPNVIMIAAWPKRQEDRAQYKVVQIALNSNFEPIMLRMYAPNFHPKLAPQWDQYEFSNLKRNAIGDGLQKFLGNFIPEKPPASWKITRENFLPPQIAEGKADGNPTPNRQ